MKKYEEIIPKKYYNSDYEKDVPEIVKDEAEKQFKKGEGLYLWGNSGNGKTHIACALAKNIIKQELGVLFYNTGLLLERFREEFDSRNTDPGYIWDVMKFEGVLILDDIGAEKASEWTRERIYLIINKRYEDMLPIIFTSNCDIETLSDRLGDRILSRIMEMSSIININGSDKRLPTN